MGRKRREGITSSPRFELKAFSVGMARGSGNKRLAENYASALTQARAMGVGVYTTAYQTIKPVLMTQKVPPPLWGLYKAFVNEYISKVQRKGVLTADECINKWADPETGGLDDGALRACIDALGEVVTPASKQ